MKFLRSRFGILILCLVVLVALFLFRPGATRLKTRIATSISLSLGRPVEISAVHLRLLPQPGFDLDNFIVYDNPAFSAEPMLRASEVTAALRVRSLLRGKLEIARLDLTEPSLNLVRNSTGHWNVENLVERAAKTPVAPTSKSSTEVRPGFPYIGAKNGRINFKFGHEKKAYALTDADFSLWQDSENSWGMRLKAQPTRTDYNLGDTGILRVNGSWQRAYNLRETPLQFSFQWEQAQLGQLTKLFYGQDRGWRGGVEWSTSMEGTPADLQIKSATSIEDFRRYDIARGGSLRLAAQCSGHFSSINHSFSNLNCRAPVGEGVVRLEGNIASLSGPASYDLAVLIQDVPMQEVAALAQRIKQNLPDDLVANGTLQAKFALRPVPQGQNSAEPMGTVWEGTGEAQKFRLASKSANSEIAVEKIPFMLINGIPARNAKRNSRADHPVVAPPEIPHLEIGPVNLALGRPTPATLQGWVSRASYDFELQGDTQIQRLLRVAHMAGLPVSPALTDGVGKEGTAKVDLRVTGNWAGLTVPKALGTAELHGIHAEARGLNAPLEVSSASLLFSESGISAQNIVAAAAGTNWRGSLALPRGCIPGNCSVHFNLQADEIATDRFNQFMNPNAQARPWYRFLSSGPGNTWLSSLQAEGNLAANRVMISRLLATHVQTGVEITKGVLKFSGLRGDVLDGQHEGNWTLDFTSKAPTYQGEGEFHHITLSKLADLMRDNWISGTATASYRTTASGWNTAELFASAEAVLHMDMQNGVFPHISLANSVGTLRTRRFQGKLTLHNSRLEFSEGKLEMPSGIYQVSGIASLGRMLNVKLTRNGTHGYQITGPLSAPRVAQTDPPETRAALKP